MNPSPVVHVLDETAQILFVHCASHWSTFPPVLLKPASGMAEDEAVRSNRIALLQAIGHAVSRTAKLTEMVVDKAEARAKAG